MVMRALAGSSCAQTRLLTARAVSAASATHHNPRLACQADPSVRCGFRMCSFLLSVLVGGGRHSTPLGKFFLVPEHSALQAAPSFQKSVAMSLEFVVLTATQDLSVLPPSECADQNRTGGAAFYGQNSQKRIPEGGGDHGSRSGGSELLVQSGGAGADFVHHDSRCD